MEIFKLVGSVFVDTEKANESLKKTDEKATSTAEKLKNAAGTVGKLAVGIGGAASAGAAALVGFANKAAEAADTVDKGSIRMGISTDAFQELAYAAGQSGVEMSTLEKAAKKLEGTDLNFDDAINQIMALGTEEERSAKAAELFGDNIAYTLAPMLQSTGEDFQGLRDRAHDLGIVMSEDSVKAGVLMGDTMDDVKKSLGSVTTQVGTQLLPIAQKVLQWVSDHMPEIQKIISQVMTVVAALVEKVAIVFEALMPAFQGVLDFLEGVFTGDWEKVWKGLGEIVKGVFDGLVELVKVPLNEVIGIINKFINKVNAIHLPDWVPGIGGNGLNIPNIPKLAKGGVITGNGLAMVGEAGAELVNLPTGATVTPLNSNNNDFSKMAENIEMMYRLMAKYLPMGMVLDSGALVSGISDKMDRNLYNKQMIAARGL